MKTLIFHAQVRKQLLSSQEKTNVIWLHLQCNGLGPYQIEYPKPDEKIVLP
jgi:hypothetical protein